MEKLNGQQVWEERVSKTGTYRITSNPTRTLYYCYKVVKGDWIKIDKNANPKKMYR